jgi:hypothetical protein
MDKTYEVGRNSGSITSVKIKDHSYDLVEFTVKKFLANEDETKPPIVDSAYTVFFSTREFTEFFGMIVNDLKERFDNGNETSNKTD